MSVERDRCGMRLREPTAVFGLVASRARTGERSLSHFFNSKRVDSRKYA